MKTKPAFITAQEMALMSHNLSKDGMAATLANGDVYRWGSFKWVGPMMRLPTDANRPRVRKQIDPRALRLAQVVRA
jgi:hypothetical protein